MQRIVKYSADILSPMRVDAFLRQKGLPPSSIRLLKKERNHIYINDREVYVIEPVQPTDSVSLEFNEAISMDDKLIQTEIPLDIVYEDADLLIINKQSDLSVHPVRTNLENTLANAVAFYYAAQGHEDFVFRCINRLDRYTSGLCILAKNPLSAQILNEAMKRREIKRTYVAICDGLFEEKEGVVDAPIGRVSEEGIARFVDFDNGQRAITNYRVIKEDPKQNISLVEFHLLTGRTHQIRVHMQYIGHPLLGDSLYNPEDKRMQRTALHACRLEFTHPLTKETMDIKKDMPLDMSELFPCSLF